MPHILLISDVKSMTQEMNNPGISVNPSHTDDFTEEIPGALDVPTRTAIAFAHLSDYMRRRTHLLRAKPTSGERTK